MIDTIPRPTTFFEPGRDSLLNVAAASVCSSDPCDKMPPTIPHVPRMITPPLTAFAGKLTTGVPCIVKDLCFRSFNCRSSHVISICEEVERAIITFPLSVGVVLGPIQYLYST
jgi:hypothetical protein